MLPVVRADPHPFTDTLTVEVSRTREFRLVALLAVVVGIAIRLAFYWLNIPLWFDEVALSLNIAGRNYERLLTPLWIQQSAPVVYLWIEKTFVSVFGVNEFSLRAFSLLAGIGVLVLTYKLADRLFGERVRTLAVCFAATGYYLIRYSGEVKPYESDAGVTLLMLLLASHYLLSKTRGRGLQLLLLGAAGLAPWASTPSIFILAGVSAALLVEGWGDKATSLRFALAFGLMSGASFAIAYELFYGPVSGSAFMRSFWSSLLINASWPLKQIVVTCLDATIEPAVGLYGTHMSVLLLFAFPLLLVGAGALWFRHSRALFTLFVLPLFCTYGAACAGLWVLAARIMLFTAPLTIVLVSLGVETVSGWAPIRWRNPVFWCLTVMALTAPVRFTVWSFKHLETHGNRELVANTLRAVRPGDAIYVYSRAAAAWMFYQFDWKNAKQADIDRGVEDIERIGPNSGNSRPRGRAVSNEGLSWQYVRDKHVELLGVSTGTFRSADPKEESQPDAGWADNEMTRIKATGSRRIWVVASEYHVEPVRLLLGRLHDEGFSCREFFRTRDTVASFCQTQR